MVVLSEPLDTRAKSLYLAYAIVFGLTGAVFLNLLLIIYYTFEGGVIILAFGTGLLIASYRFGHAAMLQEQIFIDGKEFFLITKGIKSKKRQVFELDAISNFRFLDKPRGKDTPWPGRLSTTWVFRQSNKSSTKCMAIIVSHSITRV